MLFFLDEDHSDIIAVIARRRGVDVISSHECGRNGLTDEQQLLHAAAEGRAVISRNYDDFNRLSRRFLERGLPHAGVVLVPRSMPNRHYSAIAAAIVRFDALHPDGIPPYGLMWLEPEKG
jgi:hypothetical protein